MQSAASSFFGALFQVVRECFVDGRPYTVRAALVRFLRLFVLLVIVWQFMSVAFNFYAEFNEQRVLQVQMQKHHQFCTENPGRHENKLHSRACKEAELVASTWSFVRAGTKQLNEWESPYALFAKFANRMIDSLFTTLITLAFVLGCMIYMTTFYKTLHAKGRDAFNKHREVALLQARRDADQEHELNFENIVSPEFVVASS